jgi:hypothetical protein
MPKLSLKLEEQSSDARSNEVAYLFTIENHGTLAINLKALTPRVPDNVIVVEAKDAFGEALKTRHSRLCSELTLLLQERLLTRSEEARVLFRQRMQELFEVAFREFRQSIAGAYSYVLRIFSGEIQRRVLALAEKFRASSFVIENRADVNIALQTWPVSGSNRNYVDELFDAKVKQLDAIELKLGSEGESDHLLAVEPDSTFSTSYVLRFKRAKLNSRRYNVSFDVTYVEAGVKEEKTDSASATALISPLPSLLSVVTILSGLLGVALKFAVTGAVKLSTTVNVADYFSKMGDELSTNSGVTAVILALVIFNVYEFSNLGAKLKMGIGWRSAMLIGVLSGVLGDRMLEALKTFAGLG